MESYCRCINYELAAERKRNLAYTSNNKRNGMERNTVHHEMKWTSINVQNDYLHSDSDCNLWFIYIYFNMSDEFFGGAIMMWMWWWWWRHRAHTHAEIAFTILMESALLYSTLLYSTIYECGIREKSSKRLHVNTRQWYTQCHQQKRTQLFRIVICRIASNIWLLVNWTTQIGIARRIIHFRILNNVIELRKV